MIQEQQLLTQNHTVSQILRTYGKQFKQIFGQYSDGLDGRCALGVIMCFFGWNGIPDYNINTSLQASFNSLANSDLEYGLSIIELNDSGMTFDEIADYLDNHRHPIAQN